MYHIWNNSTKKKTHKSANNNAYRKNAKVLDHGSGTSLFDVKAKRSYPPPTPLPFSFLPKSMFTIQTKYVFLNQLRVCACMYSCANVFACVRVCVCVCLRVIVWHNYISSETFIRGVGGWR